MTLFSEGLEYYLALFIPFRVGYYFLLLPNLILIFCEYVL